MTRVAGIDPGTVTFDICGLEDGAAAFTAVVPSGELSSDPGRLAAVLARDGPLDAVVGPSGYGLPPARLADLDETSLRLAFLAEPGGSGGIRGLLPAMAALREAELPVWLLPGVVHLPTVPEHRKVNRVDMGTADKLCAAALAAAEQARRLGRPPSEADFLLLELGGAFTSVLCVRDGAVVDGIGGSSGPPGARGPGCLDGEAAVLLGRVTKRHVFSGGAAAVAGGGEPDPAAWSAAEAGPPAVAWRHLMEGAEKACRSLLAVHPSPREILLSGRYAALPAVAERLGDRLGPVAPVRPLEEDAGGVSAAARGAALLADGLAGGTHAPLVEALRIREAGGTVFDHLHLEGAAEVAARWLEA